MRIIAGEHRGRQLLPPVGDATRPITDRVKQSLFDILQPGLEGAHVYDCFAGTGSMGLECLSRGSAFCTFFEADRSALARLNQNILALHAAERSRVVGGDLFRWFNLCHTRPESVSLPGADVVFLDPPYRFLTTLADELVQLSLHLCSQHLRPGAVVVFRHDSKDRLELPNLERYDQRHYGDMTLEFLRKRDEPDERPEPADESGGLDVANNDAWRKQQADLAP